MVDGAWLFVLGSWLMVDGDWFLVLCAWLLVDRSWLIVLSSWLLVNGFFVPGSQILVIGLRLLLVLHHSKNAIREA
jgi:hypothetical protein